jgi:predicted trehalose synthase
VDVPGGVPRRVARHRRPALDLFELQRLLYELRYELGNRPDWVPIPVAGIERLLESR